MAVFNDDWFKADRSAQDTVRRPTPNLPNRRKFQAVAGWPTARGYRHDKTSGASAGRSVKHRTGREA